ncbi:phosphoglycerate mutase-like protein 1 [Herrania umbratica]|uniref:Phosphoglycerate mutase-like protein 1 n=1 Tax=Herrania umbratica TaxID=108875 RepID=A0A6J1ADD7_9ROSI|nr:phosphoglycerate mutase-like protein 1 [Herrania umbratica]
MDTTAAQFPYPWQRCKIIHLVRHGQAMHNVEGDINREALLSPHLFDAELSPLGLQQVDRLRKEVHARGLLKRVELVVTSPLYRTMQTAFGVFGSESHGEGAAISAVNCPEIMAVELCRDKMGVRPCDMRRRVSECQALFPSLDFSMMDGEEDSLWNPDVREPDEEVSARMAQFMKWLWTRPEQDIVIVSHGIILQHILYVLGNDSHPTVRSALCKRFSNCELRSVVIVDKSLMGSDSPL